MVRRWTPAEDAILRQMTKDGYTARQIAEVLRRIKNAVLSRRYTILAREDTTNAPEHWTYANHDVPSRAYC